MPLTWYLTSPQAIPDGLARYGWYGSPGTPAANFDGYEQSVGGLSSGSMFPTYSPIVASHLGASSPLIMDATFSLLGLEGTVGVTIQVDETVTDADNSVYFVVYEDVPSPNSMNLARLSLTPEPFALTTPGESVYVTRSFTLSSTWALENVGIAVFVQSANGSRPVLQACLATADIAGTITVDVEPGGLEAAWHLEGPYGFAQDRVDDAEMPVFSAGEYTITWSAVEGWTSPTPMQETLILPEDGAITFSATYTGGPFTGRTDGPLGNSGSADQSAAMRDCDGDGDLDIAVACLGAPDLLLTQGAGTTFTGSSPTLLSGVDPTVHLAWGDINNDGAPDLYAARDGAANALLLNDGAGNFEDKTFGDLADADAASGAVWVDYNRDGLLDLYLVNTGTADKLFNNFGEFNGTFYFFVQGASPAGDGKSAAWADVDDDGDLDYYLVNSFHANVLYDYDGSVTFWEANTPLVMEDVGGGAGAAWGDFDNDGDLDLYFTNDGSLDRLVRKTATSWSLVDGGALSDDGHGRGVSWGDLDNDGDLDLFIARHGEYDRFLRNDGGVFVNVPLGVEACGGHANGCALGDVDGDGDLDVYVVNDGDPNVLLMNDMGVGNHWLHLDLVGDDCNRDAVGARVRLVAGGQSQLREVDGGSGYRSQNSPTVEFGLGATTTADSLIVRWPCGRVETWTDLAADRRLTLLENDVTDAPPPAGAARLALHPARPNPFNPRTEVSFELPISGRAVLEVYDLAGRLVRTLVDADLPAGPGTAVWSGEDDAGRSAATGAYLLRLRQGGYERTQRVTLVK